MSLLDGLVASYMLDEASGSAIDAHGSLDLSAQNSPGSAAGKISGGRTYVSASSQNHNLADSAFDPGTNDYSVCCWVKCSSPPYGGLVCRGATSDSGSGRAGWNIGVNSSGFFFSFHDGVGAGGRKQVYWGSGTPTANQWYFVAVTFDRDGNATLYVDGVAKNSTSISSLNGNCTTTAKLAIGSYSYNTGIFGVYFTGTVDLVTLYSRLLSASEVSDHYNGGAGLAYPFTTFQPAWARGSNVLLGAGRA